MAEHNEPGIHPLRSRVEDLWVSLSGLGMFVTGGSELTSTEKPMVYVNGEPCALVRLRNRDGGGYDLELDSRSYCLEKMGLK